MYALERPIISSDMFSRAASTLVPAGTRRIVVTMTATRYWRSYNDGYADNLSLTLNICEPLVEVGRNLLSNGDAEDGPGAPDDASANPIPCWSFTPNFTSVRYGATVLVTQNQFPAADAVPNGGSNFFAGGMSSSVSMATQSIDVSPLAGLIDTGTSMAILSVYLGGYYNHKDNMVITATFESETQQILGALSIGPVTPQARDNTTSLLPHTSTITVPVGARQVTVVMVATRLDTLYNDGYADNVSLTIRPIGEYAISGSVTDDSGKPLVGVVVSAGSGGTALTDAAGSYTFTNLIAGSYTLAPALSGYAFSPLTRTVSVPPSRTGEDFVGIHVNRPVILLLGGGASANWLCFLYEITCNDPNAWYWMPLPQIPIAQRYYNRLVNRFNAAGYTESNHYFSVLFYDWRKPLADNVETLKTRVDWLKKATGAEEVDLIGHSMGGLVARAYVQSSAYADDVAHLITLGSPHQGAAKFYPYWEAASFYRIDLPEILGFLIVLRKHQRYVQLDGLRVYEPLVYTFRRVFPGFLDLLPTAGYLDEGQGNPGYLYDEQNDNQLKPEDKMFHRNTYLAGLNANANLATLFTRTDVSTFAGRDVETPVRFYVHDPPWWEWPNWDDGEPNWDRKSQFMTNEGDGTIAAASAKLSSSPHVQEFPDVGHGDLPGNSAVMDAIFNTLGIPIPPSEPLVSRTSQADQPVLVLVLDGPADMTVIDPLGQSVGPTTTSIPDAEYISNPGDPFKLILIPSPQEGSFEIDVRSSVSGAYSLSLLDTFSPTPNVITDVTTLWDTSQSQIVPARTVAFALTYTLATSPTTSLVAETPVIELPVRVGSTSVSGRALPGSSVEIRNAETDAVLGSGATGADGHFVISLAAPLGFDQRIYPWSNGVAGVPVTAEANKVYLPLVSK